MNNGNIYNVIKKNDIIKIINSKITIIKSGNNYKALCPFHKEKTPSFYISKKYQKYYCFGCKKNGNVLNFLMEYKNISFNKAVDILSNNNFKKQNDNVEFLNLIETTNEICEIYYNNIKNSKNKNLFNFLIDRDIDNNLIETFKIGFVDNIENFLLKKFYKNNEKLNDCIKLGLIIENNKKKYDIFRNRVIFPIRNIYGNTIGFGGRFLNNEKKPKYINSKESKIFSKKKELYGIYENKIKYLKKILQ